MLEFVWDHAIQATLVATIVFLMAFNFMSRESWKGLPPGPPNLPILGSLPFLGTDMRKPLIRMAKKYGHVFTVYLGTRRCIVLNGYDVIRDALIKYSHAFSGRPSIFFVEELTHGKGIVSTQGEYWKEQRRFSHKVLKDFGFGRNLMEDKILEEVKFCLDVLDSKVKQPLSVFNIIQMAVANIIGSVVTGERMDYEDPKFKLYMKIMVEAFELVGNGGILNVFPFLCHMPGDFFGYKKVIGIAEFMRNERREDIQEHKDRVDASAEPSDFVDAYLKKMEQEKEDPETTFTEEELVATIGDLYGAGTETTSTTLTWAIIYMLHNQDVQKKVCTEIDDVIGRERLPSTSDRVKMPYTDACLCEIQRLSDIVPFGVPHGTTEDVWFQGHFIPKNTFILANLNSVHMDPALWPEPEKFDPSRFLDCEGRYQKRDQLMPFSVGKRQCLGEGLARMELFLFFTSILQRFTLNQPEGHPLPDLHGDLGITNIPRPFKVQLERRY